ncbi:hypothetical protein AMS68_000390 [Peltaster fructicola]|uniref:Interferon-related developmental regulator N-terminal domain-containing protein n=1 Tax=Peltaster fructicola TaxID=286661 RepID=A0A6H0XJG6_9PEZI|nr:hypothetical protein AMS68_000390 [Peltaster fructicola]
MHDLRKQALLESGKTVSRKARSKAGTPASSKNVSPLASRSGSRVASRNASDDEGELSDGTQWSATNSIDEMLASPDVESDPFSDTWMAELHDRIEQICDRKKSSVQGREESLNAFSLILMRHYAQSFIRSRTTELIPAIIKCVKAGQTEREVVLALKALALILITIPDETIYDSAQDIIKNTITDAQHPTAKLAAIRALGVVTFYGGASTEEVEATMDLLLEIASSDGALIEEADNADIVTASLEEWGFLATQLDDMEQATEAAMDTFVDQIDSSKASVQIAAGENIALLYEKSYTELESDEEPSSDEDDDDEASGPRMIKRYTVYRQKEQLEQSLEDLTKGSSKRVSKKDRKAIHTAFADILNTVEKPTRGPRYSTALDEDGREFGSRLKIAIHGGGRMTIDTWWKLLRLNALKRLLQGGFLEHYEKNEVVFESLPVIVEDD